MGCGAWKPCFLDAVEEDGRTKEEEDVYTPLDVTSQFQNILQIQGKINLLLNTDFLLLRHGLFQPGELFPNIIGSQYKGQ